MSSLVNGTRSVVCPKISLSAPPSAMAVTTGPGCPCNYTSDAQYNRCPQGFRCSRQVRPGHPSRVGEPNRPVLQLPRAPPRRLAAKGSERPPGCCLPAPPRALHAALPSFLVPACPLGPPPAQAYVGMSTDMVYDPAFGQLSGLCVPCDAGQFCGEGVYIKPANELARLTRELDCPAGSYCPSPGEIITCPTGYYCDYRAQFRTTCNYSALLETPEALVPVPGQLDIVTRLKRNREPIRGNYCPAGSSRPSAVCAGGYYCPNATVQIICPAGYYCKPQSIYPVKCPP